MKFRLANENSSCKIYLTVSATGSKDIHLKLNKVPLEESLDQIVIYVSRA